MSLNGACLRRDGCGPPPPLFINLKNSIYIDNLIEIVDLDMLDIIIIGILLIFFLMLFFFVVFVFLLLLLLEARTAGNELRVRAGGAAG